MGMVVTAAASWVVSRPRVNHAVKPLVQCWPPAGTQQRLAAMAKGKMLLGHAGILYWCWWIIARRSQLWESGKTSRRTRCLDRVLRNEEMSARKGRENQGTHPRSYKKLGMTGM